MPASNKVISNSCRDLFLNLCDLVVTRRYINQRPDPAGFNAVRHQLAGCRIKHGGGTVKPYRHGSGQTTTQALSGKADVCTGSDAVVVTQNLRVDLGCLAFLRKDQTSIGQPITYAPVCAAIRNNYLAGGGVFINCVPEAK